MENIMNLLSFEPFYYSAAIAILLVLLIVVLIMEISTKRKLKKLQIKYGQFMKGKEAKSLEESILSRFEQVDALWTHTKDNEKEIQAIKKNLLYVYQKMGLVRYDAFNEMGGKLSFVIVLLDKQDNGCLINAMHNREGCYIYMKQIIAGESKLELSNEESEALEMAKGR